MNSYLNIFKAAIHFTAGNEEGRREEYVVEKVVEIILGVQAPSQVYRHPFYSMV